jgi:hypothetical protein
MKRSNNIEIATSEGRIVRRNEIYPSGARNKKDLTYEDGEVITRISLRVA